MRAPHGSDMGGGPRWTGSTDRERGGAPRGADVAPTRRPRGSHAGGRTDGPDPLGVDRTAEGVALGRRARAAQAGLTAMAHGGAARRSGGVAATRMATAVAKRLGGG
uniref:Uncharacterized protein n=1 Tax=Oryza sativa subsp. japonica TaxID=39947 RepID=Q94HR4_ORYSJ|nr:Hypothetical protein [Oryza sativa Japonica Group]